MLYGHLQCCNCALDRSRRCDCAGEILRTRRWVLTFVSWSGWGSLSPLLSRWCDCLIEGLREWDSLIMLQCDGVSVIVQFSPPRGRGGWGLSERHVQPTVKYNNSARSTVYSECIHCCKCCCVRGQVEASVNSICWGWKQVGTTLQWLEVTLGFLLLSRNFSYQQNGYETEDTNTLCVCVRVFVWVGYVYVCVCICACGSVCPAICVCACQSLLISVPYIFFNNLVVFPLALFHSILHRRLQAS